MTSSFEIRGSEGKAFIIDHASRVCFANACCFKIICCVVLHCIMLCYVMSCYGMLYCMMLSARLVDVEDGQDLPVVGHERLADHRPAQHQRLQDLDDGGHDLRVPSRSRHNKDLLQAYTYNQTCNTNVL